MKQLKAQIIKALESSSNPKNAQQLDKYLKGAYKFRGLKVPQVTDHFKAFKNDIIQLTPDIRVQLATELIQSEFSEDKIFGLMALEKMKLSLQEIKDFESLFIEGYIKDWSICDGFCNRVLKSWLRELENTKYMLYWSNHDCQWLRRASCVGFITLTNKVSAQHRDVMFQICSNVIKHQERFNQLGCGWLLRNLSVVEKQRTIDFIKTNIELFSAEGLSYATEKLSKNFQIELKELRKFKNKDESQQSVPSKRRKVQDFNI